MRNTRSPIRVKGEKGTRTVSIHRATARDIAAWLQLRRLLWPGTSAGRHTTEVRKILRTRRSSVAFFCSSSDGKVCGFIEATLREYVEGFSSSPVGYIEGWYIVKTMRGTGIARRLVETAEAWAYSRGAREMASDTELAHRAAQRVHLRLGYRPIGRLVFFAKRLKQENIPNG